METNFIRQGYNQVAEAYSRDRSKLTSGGLVQKFIAQLKPQASVLDLGCGTGVPVDRMLIKKNHLVTGIDLSPVMIQKSRRNCPQGEYVVRDMRDLKPGEYQVEAAVSMYALFHVERQKHLEILKVIRSFLPSDGWLLISMGDKEFEGEHEFYGIKMWSSQYGPDRNRKIIREAGFRIETEKMDWSGGEKHQVILAQAKS
jgi:cyclopropane fatty-acyl-phospholipid synthase-like methyltransferase